MELLNYIYLVLLIVFTILYANYFRIFLKGLNNLNRSQNPTKYKVSVIVPARNEEDNIGSCVESLLHQSYPKDLYEIIVVDDESEDNTATIVKNFQVGNSNIILTSTAGNKSNLIGRVNALNCGLLKTSNEIVFITDADCITPFRWIEQIVSEFKEDVGLICGYAAIDDEKEKNFWIKIQAIEHIIFLTLCAGGIGAGLVIGATGQNMAFKKSEFLKIGGFQKMQGVSTGDDVVLLNTWKDLSNSTIKFITKIESVIKVKPVRNIVDLFNQHKRWLSSLPYLVQRVRLFYFTSSTLNLLIILGLISLFFSPMLIIFVFSCILIKIISELPIMIKGLASYRRYDLLPYYCLYGIVQSPFIIICGLASLFTKVKWKERSYKIA